MECFSIVNLICFSINRLSTQNVCELIKIIEQNGCKVSKSASEIAEKYNAKILFDPGKFEINLIID